MNRALKRSLLNHRALKKTEYDFFFLIACVSEIKMFMHVQRYGIGVLNFSKSIILEFILYEKKQIVVCVCILFYSKLIPL